MVNEIEVTGIINLQVERNLKIASKHYAAVTTKVSRKDNGKITQIDVMSIQTSGSSSIKCIN